VIVEAAPYTGGDSLGRALAFGSGGVAAGERSVLGALTALPAVSRGGSITSGLLVRGSSSDSFQLLLDGVPVYNPSHLLGLYDAFSPEALQVVSLHYSVAPAYLAAPPGGTLALITRTGAQTNRRMSIGLNTAGIRTTVEGPIGDGRSSLLLSARHSLLGTVPWMQDQRLLRWALDVERDHSPLPPSATAAPSAPVHPENLEARFHDIHAKYHYETRAGSRFIVTAYVGGDRTSTVTSQAMVVQDRADTYAVQTNNAWGYGSIVAAMDRTIGTSAFLRSTVTTSRYHADLLKDDFLFGHLRLGTQDRWVRGRFAHDNELLTFAAQQHVDVLMPGGSMLALGASMQHIESTYREEAEGLLHETYARGTLLESYVQVDRRQTAFESQLGLRMAYASNGSFLRWSPRGLVRYHLTPSLSTSAGYSRNYQFLHRLYLPDVAAAGIWLMTHEGNQPTSADTFTGSLDWTGSGVSARVEAYLRSFDNVRRHAFAADATYQTASVLLEPWATNYSGGGRGIEFLAARPIGAGHATFSYTLSRSELRHEYFHGGVTRAAPWDRKHQFALGGDLPVLPGTLVHLRLEGASGAPNLLHGVIPRERERLDPQFRLDARLNHVARVGGVIVEGNVALYNLLNRKNTWYRTPVALLDPTGSAPDLEFFPVDVYDLGFHPSFDLTVTF
jgi:hypothetical protein